MKFKVLFISIFISIYIHQTKLQQRIRDRRELSCQSIIWKIISYRLASNPKKM